MAQPTYAQWSAEWARLNIYPTIGALYQDAAPIYRAFGFPQVVPAGRLKVNYSDGATAASLAATAGLPSTGAPAFVDDKETKVFAAIASQSMVDLASLTMGGGFEAKASAEAAVYAIYDQFVTQLISTQDGETYGQLWGAGDFIGNVTQTGNQRISGSYAKTAVTSALLKQSIGKAVSNLPNDGTLNICITSPAGYEAVYTAIESNGGTTPIHTATEAFGYSNLMYRNTVFFMHRNVDNEKHTGGDGFSDFWFFNTGPRGVSTFVPDSVPPILLDGPKSTVGYLNKVWDIVLNTQVLYKSHFAAVKLTEWITT